MHWLFVICISFVIAHFSNAFGQSGSLQYWGQPTGWASNFGLPQQPAQAPLTIEDLELKISQGNLPLPDKEPLLLRELSRVEAEIEQAALARNQYKAWSDVKVYAHQILGRLQKLSTDIASFDCEKNSQRYHDLATSYGSQYGRLVQFVTTSLNMEVSDLDPVRLAVVASRETPEICKITKEKFAEPEFSKEFNRLSEIINEKTSKSADIGNQIASTLAKYLDLLRARRSSIQEKLNATLPASQIGGNLHILLFILGGACVATILGIKLFSPEIQMEWVASGQVIQFVTVMILLSVILALGLSSSLKENTLGTLLGGLAGYVLAQGVGKSAAREASRSIGQSGPLAPPPPRP